jgi:type IV pilus biogenesis protein CpaD/CtpE
MSMPTPVTLGLVVVALAGLAGCGDDKSDATATAQAAPMTCPAAETQAANPFDANELVGMTPAAAEQKAQSHGCTVRTTKQDGKELPATLDHRPDRINVAVEDGKIVEVVSIG